MLALAPALLLLAAAAAPPELKVAAPGLTVSGIDPELSGPLTDQLTRPFAPVRVITPRDIAAVLGLERQKEMLGCGSGECMAELGNALGVQGVVLGDVVKLGSAIQVNVHVIEPAGGRRLAEASTRVTHDDALFDALTQLGLDLRAQFYRALGLVAPPPLVAAPQPEPKSRGTRRFFPIPLAAGGAALITAGVFFGLAEGSYQQLTNGTPRSITSVSAATLADNGRNFQLAGAVLLGVGVVALLGGVALLLFGSRPEE